MITAKSRHFQHLEINNQQSSNQAIHPMVPARMLGRIDIPATVCARAK
jgi:hypothetical protein